MPNTQNQNKSQPAKPQDADRAPAQQQGNEKRQQQGDDRQRQDDGRQRQDENAPGQAGRR